MLSARHSLAVEKRKTHILFVFVKYFVVVAAAAKIYILENILWNWTEHTKRAANDLVSCIATTTVHIVFVGISWWQNITQILVAWMRYYGGLAKHYANYVVFFLHLARSPCLFHSPPFASCSWRVRLSPVARVLIHLRQSRTMSLWCALRYAQ